MNEQTKVEGDWDPHVVANYKLQIEAFIKKVKMLKRGY